MLLPRTLWALLLSISSVAAFKDTSPFILYSSTPISSAEKSLGSIARASTIQSRVEDVLSTCAWDLYVLVRQPSVIPTDFKHHGSFKTYFAVPEVIGEVSLENITTRLEQNCEASVDNVDPSFGYISTGQDSNRIVKVSFPPLPSAEEQRIKALATNDQFLEGLFSERRHQKVVIVYTTTPVADHPETAPHPPLYLDHGDEFPMGLHTDMKRDLGSSANNNTIDPNLPLFEKYQYFTPAIFVGGLVSILLFLILYTGVTAVSSLQVSYFAFNKEMGPAAQKKQQQ